MKIIFLDFDGVLNSGEALQHEAGPEIGEEQKPHDWVYWGIFPGYVRRVAKLVKRTGAKVVLSTSWRLYRPIEQLIELLERCGLPKGCVIDRTPGHENMLRERGHEIADWVRRYNDNHTEIICRDDIVILDDMPAGYFHPYADRLVHVREAVGITERNIAEAERKLGRHVLVHHRPEAGIACTDPDEIDD